VTALQKPFGPVLFVVCGVAIVAGFLALVSTGKTWENYGRSRLLMGNDLPGGPRAGSAAALLERDTEIRQLLEARNARRQRRGETPIDIEQELARLTTPQIDGELRGEIRDLVIARNHRRARAGKPPLDVDAEVEREIAALSTL
jgi:hypothetical protein